MGPSFFNSTPVFSYLQFVGRLILLPRLLYYFCHVSLNCACWASFGLAMYFSFTQFILPSISAGLILIPSSASLAHFIPLGILSPLHSFGHPWSIPFLQSHGLLLNLSSFPSPITVSFNFWVCWLLNQPHLLIPFFGLFQPIFAYFPLLMIPMSLLLSSLGSPRPVCFLYGIFYYFIGLWTIIPTIQV